MSKETRTVVEARQRNGTKFTVMGNLGNLHRTADHSPLLTDGERQKILRAVEVLKDLIYWWDHNTTELGFKTRSESKIKDAELSQEFNNLENTDESI